MNPIKKIVSTLTICLDCQSESDETQPLHHPTSESLYRIISQALLHDNAFSAGVPTLLYTKARKFRIVHIHPSKIDAEFAIALRLTQQAVDRILRNQPSSEERFLSDALKRFSELQLLSIGDMIPLMERYIQLIQEELFKNNKTNLQSLFAALYSCIEGQEKLYAMNPYLKEMVQDEKKHIELFSEKIEEIVSVREEAQNKFPETLLPKLTLIQSLGMPELTEIIKYNISPFLNKEASIAVMSSLKDHLNIWELFHKASKKAYFKILIKELSRYNSLDEVPSQLLQAFHQSRYINIDELLLLNIFKKKTFKCLLHLNSYLFDPYELCLSEVLKCVSLETLAIGPETPTHFLDSYFQAIVTAHSKTLTGLIIKGRNIRDDHFEYLADCSITYLELYGTELTGKCLSSPIFKAVKKASIGCSRNITDIALRGFASEELEELKIYALDTRGAFLSSPCYSKITSLEIVYCPDITDSNLMKISTTQLKTLRLLSTNLTGKCLIAPSFNQVESLEIKQCYWFDTDNLAQMPNNSLKELILGAHDLRHRSLLNNPRFQKLKVISYCTDE